MSVEPAINWQFHKAPGLIDPRARFTRTGAARNGRVPNRLGVLSASPANTGRWRFNPASFLCEGLLVEPQHTNLLLRSEEFDDAAWIKTSCTVTANSAMAPDGTMTADTLAATGAGGTVAQAVTITAGRGIALSVHARPNASSWLILRLSDGTNTVEAWFNLAAGTASTNTAGGGTCVFSAARIEPAGAGWMRASLEVTTNTSTAFTASIAPAAADAAAPARGTSIDAWGAQLEAEATLNSPTSYIPTAGSTVNLAWHGRELDPAFQESLVVPATPSRGWDVAQPLAAHPPVPPLIPSWKGKAALREAGLLGAVEAAVEVAGGRIADAWAGAPEWSRDSEFLSDLAVTLGLTDMEIDHMFLVAAGIRS